MQLPFILVHGIVATEQRRLLAFWGRIPEALRAAGVPVFFGRTDAWGTVETNAAQLADTVDRVLLATKAPQVRILAHSKGGVDARYCLWRYGASKVASLDTVGSPHRGSPLADQMIAPEPMRSLVARRALRTFGRWFLDELPDPGKVLEELSTGWMARFNETVSLPPELAFQAWYSAMSHPWTDPLFFFSNWHLERVAGPNDGVVPVSSAAWGPHPLPLGRGVSHGQQVDTSILQPRGFSAPEFVLKRIVGRSDRV